MIDPEKLRTFLMDAKSYNKEAYDKSGENRTREKDPYWLGRMAMCSTLLGWVEAGVFEEEK